VDGHDVQSLVKVLRDLKEIGGPKLLHAITVKGKGYAPAEQDQRAWHAPGRFNPETGERDCRGSDAPALFQDVFGETLLELARTDERIVGITPAMPSGSSLNIMMAEMPTRVFDVGIAEGHAVTFAAGLAAAGMVPFCAIYSSFIQRAYDNIIHDVAIAALPVVLCIDRGGLVGEDGSTHQGVFDLPALLPVPNMIIASPMDEEQLRELMYTASRAGRPFVVRYPRGCGPGVAWRGVPFAEVAIGTGRKLRDGSDVAVLTFGPVGNAAAEAIEQAAAEGISVAHYDLRFAKPLDEELLHEVGRKFTRVITVEDGAIRGGVGSAVGEFFAREGYVVRVECLGVGDRFVEHGSPAELYRLCGYDAAGILDAIRRETKD
jgi:1-deoxy-D-xylulose-5-phosphate synthase